jgi:hypothetical protein
VVFAIAPGPEIGAAMIAKPVRKGFRRLPTHRSELGLIWFGAARAGAVGANRKGDADQKTETATTNCERKCGRRHHVVPPKISKEKLRIEQDQARRVAILQAVRKLRNVTVRFAPAFLKWRSDYTNRAFLGIRKPCRVARKPRAGAGVHTCQTPQTIATSPHRGGTDTVRGATNAPRNVE